MHETITNVYMQISTAFKRKYKIEKEFDDLLDYFRENKDLKAIIKKAKNDTVNSYDNFIRLRKKRFWELKLKVIGIQPEN